jgi:hypothetical protein
MDDLLTGSMPSWLSAAATALSPLIALLVGFVGADRWLRWLLSDSVPRLFSDTGPFSGYRVPTALPLSSRTHPIGIFF